MGFQKKVWVGGVSSSIQVYFGFLEFFNFAKPLRANKNKSLIHRETHQVSFLIKSDSVIRQKKLIGNSKIFNLTMFW